MDDLTPDGPITPPAHATEEITPDSPIAAPGAPVTTIDVAKQATSGYSLPTSLGDAAHRIAQGGLFLTPHEEPADGAPISPLQPPREGPLPAPAFVGDAVAGVIGRVGDMIPAGARAAAASDAAKYIPATVKYALGLLSDASTVGRMAVQAAAALGPRAEAIAHYLTAQRDPAYAASLQKKDK